MRRADCRAVGRFRVRGREGQNRIRFYGRLGGRLLPRGVYTITPRTVRRSERRTLPSVTVAIRKPGRPVPVRRPGARRSCIAVAATTMGSDAGSGTVGASPSSQTAAGDVDGAARSEELEQVAQRTQAPEESAWIPYVPPETSSWLQVLLVAALALAALLLALAAVPATATRESRLSGLLESWRLHIGATALSTLLAAVALFFIARAGG